jgi:hypothetical protein
MAGLLDVLTQTLNPGTTAQISQQIGAQPAQTQTAIAAAIPMLLTALTHNASTPQGAASLHNALGRHDGSILGQLGGLIGQGGSADGAGILGHLLGGKREDTQQSIARTSGLTPQQIGMLLTMLAPIVMGALGKHQREKGLDAGGLATELGQEHAKAAEQSPDLFGMATSMLTGGDPSQMLGNLTKGLGGLFGGR